MVEVVDPRLERNAGRFLSFDDVQDRLVAAMLTAWRLPDRERGWLKVRAMWPDVLRHNALGDHGDMDADRPLPTVPLTRRDHREMDEAFGWLDVVEGDDRRLIGLAVSALAGGESRVPWRRLLGRMGLVRGADGLRMRYRRAMLRVVQRANGGNPG